MSTTVRSDAPAMMIPTGDPAGLVPFVLGLDEADGPHDVIDVLSITPFVTGSEPWARSTKLDRVRPDALLMPAGGRVVRSSDASSGWARLVIGDGWTLHAVRWRQGGAYVTVSATSDELAERILAEAIADAVEPPDPATVAIGFWHRSGRAVRNERTIVRQSWAELRENYTAPAAAALDRLMRLTPQEIRGRLILLHGAPGTGKTTALRSLATEWSQWCQVDCVLDPDRLFSDPAYLMEVTIGGTDGTDAPEGGPWRLLLLEDCDELIRSEAKAATGQALSRLLNLTDGLLGQGRNVLVAITTNEDLARLHPATVRPGRCLAQIEVGPLTHAEAVAWLARAATAGADQITASGATLAQLYALRDGDPVGNAETGAPTGLYL